MISVFQYLDNIISLTSMPGPVVQLVAIEFVALCFLATRPI